MLRPSECERPQTEVRGEQLALAERTQNDIWIGPGRKRADGQVEQMGTNALGLDKGAAGARMESPVTVKALWGRLPSMVWRFSRNSCVKDVSNSEISPLDFL